MIAFHYPPCYGSSGLQRTLSFSRHLPKYGWQPIVLTANSNAYPSTSDGQMGDIPEDVIVKRAPALDVVRHLSLKGRYFAWQAIPDRWTSWALSAVPQGLKIIKQYNPDLIWSTYPIATAHRIGASLQRLTGKPWIADFRDPMLELDPKTQQPFPSDKRMWRARERIEQKVFHSASAMVFTTNGAKSIFKERYNIQDETKLHIISNGFEDDKFPAMMAGAPSKNGHLTLLHSGTLYPSDDRHPKYFFDALSKMKKNGSVASTSLKVILRATGYDDLYARLIAEKGLSDIVYLEPAISYSDAIQEMVSVDGLLVFQGYTSNPAIPAKLYEYIRAKRPIFALVDSKGDTAHLLKELNVGTCVPLNSPALISKGFEEFLGSFENGSQNIASDEQIQVFSRKNQTERLANLLESVSA